MADKKKLTGSFGTSRRRPKPSLDEIEKIVSATDQPAPPASSAPAPRAPKSQQAPPEKPTKRPRPAAKKKAPATRTNSPEPAAVPMKKTSVDLPLALYQDLKIHLIKKQLKFREYLTELIEADLKKKG